MPTAAISAATSIVGGIAQGSAASNAAKQQNNASQATIGANNQLLNQVGTDTQPQIGAGGQSANALSGLLGIGGNPAASQQAFQNYLGSTNYNFLLNQGEQSQQYLTAPNLISGSTGKALNNYAQGMAGNALQGYEGLLQGQEQIGNQASGIYANAGTNLAGQNAQARNLAAGTSGSAGFAGANAATNALSGVGNLFGSSYGQVGNALNGLGLGSPSNGFGTAQYTGLPNSYTMGTGIIGTGP